MVLPPAITAHHSQLQLLGEMLWTRSGNLVNIAWDKKREKGKGEGGRNSPVLSLVVLPPGCVAPATEAAVVLGVLPDLLQNILEIQSITLEMWKVL